MAFEQEQRAALRILDGIELGSLRAAQAYELIESADPTLVYFIFTWLREHYPPSHPASNGVLGRITEVCKRFPSVPRQVKEGQTDVVVTWFEDTYNYRDLGSREFIALIVEKLEG